MAKVHLPSEKYRDELVYRQIQISRYITGQVNFTQALIDELNETIARFCLKKKRIETKGQYTECRVFIRVECLKYREKLFTYLQKEIKDFIKEQSKWVYEYFPLKLEKADRGKITQNVFFTAYSDTDTIKSYVTRIFNQIFQTWNAQLTIAYGTGITMPEMVELVLDREF